MRLRTLVVWVAGLAVLGWAAYTALSAASAYIATGEMIDQVVGEVTPKMRAAAASGQREPFDALAAEIRETLLVRAQRYGIPLDPRDLAVRSDGRGISVKLRWSYPVIRYGRNPLLLIPMSLERYFEA